MNTIKKLIDWINRMLADPSGIPDDARVAGFLIVLGYIGIAVYNVAIEHHPFDMQQYGIGAGAMSAGIGVWFGVRKGN